jgi:asparagine synthase (glutamine-hydrolysing)
MCGIAGALGPVQPSPPATQRILGALDHRGPDGRGAKAWPFATLLHTRLRIIDPSPAGDQPMSNEDGSVWTVFNGELYNHRELQTELEARGHRFRGRSDTEVLPHLYEEHGSDLFRRLRGMFALAILDLRGHRMLLARDRFGIKPLFYGSAGGSVVFASELNALRGFDGLDLAVDSQAVADYTALLFVPPPLTLHVGVRAVVPGETVDCQLEEDGHVRTTPHRFHRFAVAPDRSLTVDRAADDAESLIAQAVRRQFESDVPLGALLSGGIDSSLVSLFGQLNTSDGLHTFNVRSADPASDETWAAQRVAEAIGSHHQTLDMDSSTGTFAHVTSLLRQPGQPFADSSLFAVDAVARTMRRHVTVALAGDGGDEGFGGYDAYWQLGVIDRLRLVPAGVSRAAASILGQAARRGLAPQRLASRVGDIAGADDTGIVQALFSWVRAREHSQLLRDPSAVLPPQRLFEPQWPVDGARDASRLERLSALAVEVNIRLIMAGDYLPKVDTASMRHGLEVRVPLLDEDLFDFALTLPHRLRVDGHRGKRVLREVASRHLDRDIVDRRKQGFTVPVDRWLTSSAKAEIRSALLASDAPVADYLRRDVYRPWVEAFHDGRQVAGISAGGLYQRVVMLLALDLGLRDVARPA